MDEVHDFYGPYQIQTTHDGHRLVFVKGVYEAFDMDSEKLNKIVKNKIFEHRAELLKWESLLWVLDNA